MKSHETEKANTKTEINRRPGESQASYLNRASRLVTDLLINQNTERQIFAPKRTREEDLSQEALGLISEIMEEARRESTPKVDRTTDTAVGLEYIAQSIGTHRASTNTPPMNEATFEETQRSRRLFELQRGKGAAKDETYWNTLFFPYNTESTRAFARELLSGKRIVLLGGGRARIREEMEQSSISPREVLNIDPFVHEVYPDADPVVSASAADEHLLDILYEYGFEKADEIWAVYSVPAYLDKPDEILTLFGNIDALLATNGSARIWPATVKYSSDETEVARRTTALMEALGKFAASGKYEITPFEAAGRPGFTLRKLIQKRG